MTRRRAALSADAERDEPPSATRSLDRLIFLSDGVFAIAMTLLVVALAAPELPPQAVNELPARLLEMRPRFISFVISFLVIAAYWASHHRIFQEVVRADRVLVWLNLVLLLCIAFQPFPTAVLGAYNDQPIAVSLYAATLAVTGLVILTLWLYATLDHRLVRRDVSGRLILHHALRAVSAPAVFLVSIAIAQSNPFAAELSWLAIAVMIVLLRLVFRDQP